MKKRRIQLIAIIFAIIFPMTACGTPLHALTEDEEKLIVHYAAHVVSKYNITQTDGMNGSRPSLEEEEDKKPVASEAESQKQSETENPNNTNDNSDKTGGEEPPVSSGTISLADAIEAKGFEVKYKGLKTAESYNEDKVYNLTAGEGNKYIIMNFSISNSGDKERTLDTYSKNFGFYASFDGGEAVAAEQTFLTYSLSTFMGKIKPGKTIDVVLLFQVSAMEADSVKDAKLMIKKGDSTFSVEL